LEKVAQTVAQKCQNKNMKAKIESSNIYIKSLLKIFKYSQQTIIWIKNKKTFSQKMAQNVAILGANFSKK
jgi:hypothetical protein